MLKMIISFHCLVVVFYACDLGIIWFERYIITIFARLHELLVDSYYFFVTLPSMPCIFERTQSSEIQLLRKDKVHLLTDESADIECDYTGCVYPINEFWFGPCKISISRKFSNIKIVTTLILRLLNYANSRFPIHRS